MECKPQKEYNENHAETNEQHDFSLHHIDIVFLSGSAPCDVHAIKAIPPRHFINGMRQGVATFLGEHLLMKYLNRQRLTTGSDEIPDVRSVKVQFC